jgi:hypothetical protein
MELSEVAARCAENKLPIQSGQNMDIFYKQNINQASIFTLFFVVGFCVRGGK